MKTQIRHYAHRLRIHRAGEIRYFQIQLPLDTQSITGIQFSEHLSHPLINPLAGPDATGGGAPRPDGEGLPLPPRERGPLADFRYPRSPLLGELRLQSLEKADLFYREYLYLDALSGWGDFSANAFWKPAPPTHQNKRTVDPVLVDGATTLVQGMYLDALAKNGWSEPPYTLDLYLRLQLSY